MNFSLRDFFKDVADATAKYGVVGFPLEHTLSPALQEAALRASGLDAVYRKIEVPPEAWEEFLRQAADLPLNGFNITVPHKERLARAPESLGGEAVVGDDVSLTGAVNTVDREQIGEEFTWALYNTDGYGFLDDLRAHEIEVEDKNVVLLGAGGAARAVLALFNDMRPARLTLVNRTPDKAQKLAAEFIDKLGVEPDQLAAAVEPDAVRGAVAEARLLVNATSAGLAAGGAPPVDLSFLHKDLSVYDMIYHRETELMAAARAQGARVVGGLGMLVRQGAEAFRVWFGKRPPIDVMRKAAEEELKKRSHTPS